MVLLYTTLAALTLSALCNGQAAGVGGAGAGAGAAGAAGAGAAGAAGATTTTSAAAGATSSSSESTVIDGSDLVGTWSTKSNRTFTGPGFYDPLNERMIEPSHPGISYSFTSDGYYEEAYYRAVANPTSPQCPSGIMQWQHGKWTVFSNGSLALDPIKVDGRQLLSSPCKYKTSVFTRYNQTEQFERYSVYIDPYHGIKRLDLFQFNGAPMQPMYLALNPPQMLPTTTLNPLNTATATGKSKRGVDAGVPISWNVNMGVGSDDVITHINTDRLWWIGVGMTGLGGLLYLGPRRMGVNL